MFKIFVKQTEVNSGGGIRISVYKQSFGPDGKLIAEQPHQIIIGPFDDFDAIIADNNDHLQQMGYPPIDPAELALPIALRASAHSHAGVQERMAIEAVKIEAKRVADEEVARKEAIAEQERASAAAAQAAARREAEEAAFSAAVAAEVAKLGR